MKKNKGFTLIELLAVIVILAVVAIVAIPITINIIETSRKGALKDSAYGLIDAADMYYTRNMQIKGNEDGYVDFAIVNGEQTSTEKLNYKGKIENGYLRLTNNKEIALCIDDNKYFAVKNIENDNIYVDEGVCSGEYDEETLGYITIGGSSYIGMRLSLKQYTSVNSLPNKANNGAMAVITNQKISDYFISKNAPSDPKEGTIWIVQDSDANVTVNNKTSEIGVAYALQYEKSEWLLRDAYVYNDEWQQLNEFKNQNWEYDYTGEYQEFTVASSGYYQIELWGASGGRGYYDGSLSGVGGLGAYTKGEIFLKMGETLYIYVGGRGTEAASNDRPGGWNGGGQGSYDHGDDESGGSGGGATDVRIIATSAKNVWNEEKSLRSRIMVAAGGGGGVNNTAGGSAGGITAYGTNPGSQISGGGSFGIGKDGIFSTYNTPIPGGGGGWYGGGTADDRAGGGGSSYISGHKGCVAIDELGYHIGSSISNTDKYFINDLMVDGKGNKWTTKVESQVGMPDKNGIGKVNGNSGDGYAKIKFLGFAYLNDTDDFNKKFEIENEWVFNSLGYYQTFVVPKTGTYKIELWGAQGGYGTSDNSISGVGGYGGYTSGEISLQKNEILYVYVGQNGLTGASYDRPGGWNGGGQGSYDHDDDESGGSGGGATDIRIIATSAKNIWNEMDSLKSRIMVAAGGGGGVNNVAGGAAGGLTAYGTNPGSQISGGGSFAIGKDGIFSTYNTPIPDGGAGWFGGGTANDAAGGGGSSYISGHNGCIGVKQDGTFNNTSSTNVADSYSYTGYKFTNTKMIDGQGYSWTDKKGSSVVKMPSQDGLSTMNGNSGNGYAKITFVK